LSVSALLKRSVDGLADGTRAELVLQGKRESFFRDLFARQVALENPNVLCKPEWDIPRVAAERWVRENPSIKKSKGVVDLALLSPDDLFTERPLGLVEFKLWYSVDAVSPSKFADSSAVHHSIPKSAAVDRGKIRAVRNGAAGVDYLVTYVVTPHIDRVPVAPGQTIKTALETLGVAYWKVLVNKKWLEEGYDSIRTRGVQAAAEAVGNACGETTVAHLGTGVSRGVPVSIDCLLTEV
jgi:hypothetical protein